MSAHKQENQYILRHIYESQSTEEINKKINDIIRQLCTADLERQVNLERNKSIV